MRLFVASPSDVAAERTRVDVVAARLNGEFEGMVRMEVIRWETGFYTADRPASWGIWELDHLNIMLFSENLNYR
jgi:hypothetical protein